MTNEPPARRHDARLTVRAAFDADLLPVFLHRFDREQTRRAYRNDLVQFFGSDVIPLDLARQPSFVHVNAHIADMEAGGLKPTTIKRRIAALRTFFDWLVALELIDSSPASRHLLRRVRTSRSGDRRIIFLTRDQARGLLEATATAGDAAPRDYALLSTLIHCVLRRAEAAGMDTEHIRPLGRYWVLDLPHVKGGADQYVKVPTHVVDCVEAMKRHYGIASGPIWRSLSNNHRGRRLSPDAIYQIVKRTALRAGLPDDIGAHSLRHTGCTLAIEAGASLQQVQTHARHKQLETTMIYVHQRDKLRDSAADQIDLEPTDVPEKGSDKPA
jgi:site-specific recombinase XerD